MNNDSKCSERKRESEENANDVMCAAVKNHII